MSEKRQRGARDPRDTALERQRAARQRPTHAAARVGEPADVREVAVLDAHAGGVTVSDHLRDAALSYSAGSQDHSGRELGAQLRAARRDAARLLARSRAVHAQNAQVAARRSQAGGVDPHHSGAARRAADDARADPDREEG
jgi:hypothetical protein